MFNAFDRAHDLSKIVVVGFDLVETGASPDHPIDAIVAARLLYRLCGVVTTQHARA